MSDTLDHSAETLELGARAANRSWLKMGLDRSFALVGLIAISPFLIAIALAVRLDSPGPSLFIQSRYGRYGRIFKIYKFRTMTAHASLKPFKQASANDARVTRLGRLLRNSSIDELPQLINVVLGDMALVGPRPHPPTLDEQYKGLIPNYMQRYSVRPGITGLAQIGGHRGATPSVESMAERVALDLAYIAGWSFWSDIKILLRTLRYVLEPAHDR